MTRVAIVLGAAVRPDGTASPALQRRAETAAQLYLDGYVAQIIASGGVPRSGRSEAEVIAEICTSSGVPPSAISLDEISSNTLENIRNSKALLPDNAKIILVTDTYHTFRARLIAREFGLKVGCVSPKVRKSAIRRVVRGYLREAAAIGLYGVQRVGRLISPPSP